MQSKVRKLKMNVYRFARLFSLVLVGIFIFTAWGKIVYPVEQLKFLERGIGSLEIVLSIALILFYKKPLLWAGVSGIFSLWAGYSLFFVLSGEMCGCIGKLIEIPSVAFLIFDFVAVFLSQTFAYFLYRKNLKARGYGKGTPQRYFLNACILLTLGVMGYFTGLYVLNYVS